MVALAEIRRRLWLDTFGLVSAIAWLALAVASHSHSAVPLCLLVSVLAVAWMALLSAWRSASIEESAGWLPRVWFWAVLFRMAGLAAAPVLDDDYFRFLWDGYRFAQAGTPYGVAPIEFFGDDTVPLEFQRVLDSVNHPQVPTIYGPVCEWFFRLAYTIAPANILPWKLVLVAADLATLALLSRMAAPANVLLYAWCPLLIQETAFNAHPEAIGVFALILAIRWVTAGRGVLAGAAMAIAAGVKLTGGLLAPLLLLRGGWKSAAGMAAGAAVLWGPFWMQGSLAELPGFTEMSRQWEFNSSVFALISWFAGRFPAQVAGALGLILLYVYHEVRLPGRAEWPRGDWVYGGFFLLVPVVNPWYLLWVLPFAVIRPSAWALSSLAFVSMSYVHGLNLGSGGLAPYEHPAWLRPLEYGGIAAGAWCGREVVRRLA